MAKSGAKWELIPFCGFSGSPWAQHYVSWRTAHQFGCEGSYGRPFTSARVAVGAERRPYRTHRGYPNPCLALYPLPEWERIESDVQALPALNPAVKRFQRLVLGYASDLQLDGSGRVLVPPALREYAQLDRRAVLVGQGNKLEIWSEDLWQQECAAALATDSSGELPAELMQLNL